MRIFETITVKEAALLWNKEPSTIRRMLQKHCKVGYEYRKSEGTWIVTRDCMIRIYGLKGVKQLEKIRFPILLKYIQANVYNRFDIASILSKEVNDLDYDIHNNIKIDTGEFHIIKYQISTDNVDEDYFDVSIKLE